MLGIIVQAGMLTKNVEAILSRVPGTNLDIAYFATIEEAGVWLATPSMTTPTGLRVQPTP